MSSKTKFHLYVAAAVALALCVCALVFGLQETLSMLLAPFVVVAFIAAAWANQRSLDNRRDP